MRKSTRRKLKVYAVDAAMILLAAQVTVVLKADNKAEASTYTTIQAIQDEQAETGSDAETLENDTKYISASEDELNWNNKDSDILLKIAMAEAEGEGTEGKALVMKVVLNRVENKEFPRDIYEAVANQAARRVRACILGIIPSDVVEAAVDRCNKTLREGYEEPLVDRVRKMAEVFEKEFSVNISMIEKYLGCKSDAFSENDFVRLKKVYRTLRDGMAKREDYFEIGLPVTDNSEISDPFSGGEKKQEAGKEGDKK